MIEQYKRDGFVVLQDVTEPPIACSKERLYWECRRVSSEGYRALCRAIAAQSTTYLSFLTRPLLLALEELGISRPLFQTNPVAHFMAPDLWHEGVGAHQDWPALQSGLDTVVAWMPFYDVGLDDYPVEVVPGSHLRGLLPNKAGEHINEIDTADMEFVPITMNKGDVLLFSAFTVHRTRTSGTGFRAAISHRYENSEDHSFVARGYPSAQRRVIDREVKWAPSVEEVRRVFA